MKHVLNLAVVPLLLLACGTTEEPSRDTGADTTDTAEDSADAAHDATDTAGDTSTGLLWYPTCGDPVCSGHTDRGVTPCDSQTAGATCDEAGSQCDPIDNCNALLLCANRDPRLDGCPISRQGFKHNIHYLTPDERAAMASEVLRWPLATWRYNGAPDRDRLGFVLEDLLASPAADPARDQVDLYAALSMAIATLQVQAEQIAALQAQVEALQQTHTR